MWATRKKRHSLVLLLSLLAAVDVARASTHCEQKWDDIKAPHIVAETYHIHLLKVNTTEEYQSFMPNTKYQVAVRSDDADVKFTRFYLTVENENRSLGHGRLELYDVDLSQFSQDCPDSVVQTSQMLKDEISTYWISPDEGSGCVTFRVSIMESPSRWFMDGSLEQRFCQDPKASIDDPGPVLPECCACDEAKYELAFEGLWSRYTHPKHFPRREWVAVFPTVLGVSHSPGYNFWRSYEPASRGLEKFALTGDTVHLESELKSNLGYVPTKYYPPDFDPSKIPRMKLARNRQYTVRLMAPFNMRCKTCGEYIYKGKKFNARKEDVEGDTYLGIRIYRFYIKCTRCLQEISFKTDPKNTDYEIEAGATRNFMALKLAEEQAQREEDEEKEEEATNPMKLLEKRTQQSKQELDLLESLEDLKDLNRRQQTIDYDVMLEQYDTSAERQRTEKEQEELDEQLVKEIFKNKKRTIGKVVEEETVELEDDATATTAAAAAAVVTDEPSNKMQKTAPKACRVTAWSDWGECSETCGPGVKRRTRQYKNEKSAAKRRCESRLTDEATCQLSDKCPDSEPDPEKCPLTEWAEWSACSRSCGPESKTRERTFRGKRRRKQCQHLYPGAELRQTEDCGNPECAGGEPDKETTGDAVTVSEHTEEEASSEPPTDEPPSSDDGGGGGGGDDDNDDDDDDDDDDNDGDDDDMVGAENVGRRYELERPDYTTATFVRRRKKVSKCVRERYTEWSLWSPCSVTCGLGTKSRSRQIKPGWDEPATSPDRDLSLYECQFESTTCIAETASCDITREQIEVICSQPLQPGRCPDGHNDNSLRYYYDKPGAKCDIFHYAGCEGNMNNFRTQQECQDTCLSFLDYANLRKYKLMLSGIVTYNIPYTGEQQIIKAKRTKCDEEDTDEESTENAERKKKKKKKHRKETKSNSAYEKSHCKVTEWGSWSPCFGCKGYRTMSREILAYPRNGGKACPTKLIRRQKCHKVMPECDKQKSSDLRNLDRNDGSSAAAEDELVQCRVSEWSAWTSCSASCGAAQRWRTRYVAAAGNRGSRARPCPPLTEIEECRLPPC
ncbi:spondin-1-like [Copidosoma floridanum]|uniref:spondin-1-like n=1 Tax=Copidosoma floridanum TaxID=29053 RepID=UPI000C6F896F|nr:spondin-1-like [Copidosoma floridanum]